MTATFVYLLTTLFSGADVACAEATHHWDEVEAVLQVAHNRAASDHDLLYHLTAPRQFARGCPTARLRVRHFLAAARAMAGRNRVPAWLQSRNVRWFCTEKSAWKWRRRGHWSARRALRPVGRLRHIYWAGRVRPQR